MFYCNKDVYQIVVLQKVSFTLIVHNALELFLKKGRFVLLSNCGSTSVCALSARIGHYPPPIPLHYKNEFKISTTCGQ